MYKLEAISNGVSHTKDGGLRLTFVTNELTPEQKMEVIKSFQAFGILSFEETARDE